MVRRFSIWLEQHNQRGWVSSQYELSSRSATSLIEDTIQLLPTYWPLVKLIRSCKTLFIEVETGHVIGLHPGYFVPRFLPSLRFVKDFIVNAKTLAQYRLIIETVNPQVTGEFNASSNEAHSDLHQNYFNELLLRNLSESTSLKLQGPLGKYFENLLRIPNAKVELHMTYEEFLDSCSMILTRGTPRKNQIVSLIIDSPKPPVEKYLEAKNLLETMEEIDVDSKEGERIFDLLDFVMLTSVRRVAAFEQKFSQKRRLCCVLSLLDPDGPRRLAFYAKYLDD